MLPFFFLRRRIIWPLSLSTYLIWTFFNTRIFNMFRRKISFRFTSYTAFYTSIQQTNTDHNTEYKYHIWIFSSHDWSGFTLFRSQHVLIDAFNESLAVLEDAIIQLQLFFAYWLLSWIIRCLCVWNSVYSQRPLNLFYFIFFFDFSFANALCLFSFFIANIYSLLTSNLNFFFLYPTKC